jgi:DMSO/TMAO reductase YedYZ molybdopterin-dependent catalytic subunit
MARSHVARAVTGLAAGALLTALLLGVLALGSLAKISLVPFTVFDWLVRVLPGSVVTFGLDLTLRGLDGLGFNIKDTAKTAEQVLALVSLFFAGLVIGLVFFLLVRAADETRIKRYGVATGAVLGLFSAVVTLVQGVPGGFGGKAGLVIWALALFLLWGWGLARLYLGAFPTAGPASAEPAATAVAFEAPTAMEQVPAGSGMSAEAEAHVISRRRFIIQVGGLAATIVVFGSGVAYVLRAQATRETPGPVGTPVTFPNAHSQVQPVPGTRSEYTPVADHYRVDIGLTSPEIDGAAWRLTVDGLVSTPLSLTLDEIKSGYRAVDQFVTLSCISNMLGGPFIGTTLWTGVPLRDLLADAGPASGARYAHIKSADGFYEEVDLELVDSDPRILLTYAWDGQPLPREHGFPLRIFIPDRYGMKQPKWVTGITLTEESIPGYWVARGWDEKAEVKTTSVIDTVAVKSLLIRGGQTFVPVGGIAYSGAKGISKVEIQIDDGPWEAAELRAPLSALTWVIWRYDWPFSEGTHRLTVRAYDGQGRLQETGETVSHTGSAVTGLYSELATIPPMPAVRPGGS